MISASPTAPLGSVEHLDSYTPALFSHDSVILCRNTAPLISFAFQLIRRGVGCRVLGKEIGTGLVLLVKKLNAISLEDLSKRLEMWETHEVEKFEHKQEFASAENVRDKATCLQIFISDSSCNSIESLCRKISSLFDDTTKGLLTLSTVHKAKGLEWETVFLLDRFKLMPSPWCKTEWGMKQEENLIYVALTRAKLHLKYIKSNSWQVL